MEKMNNKKRQRNEQWNESSQPFLLKCSEIIGRKVKNYMNGEQNAKNVWYGFQ